MKYFPVKNKVSKGNAASAGVMESAWEAAMLKILPPTLAYNSRKYLHKSENIYEKLC